MKFGVVTFPGSNCDYDAYMAVKEQLSLPVDFVWHKDSDLGDCDCVILPGGFSYGDYLRTGAIARFSPVMHSVMNYAERGGLLIGICNGFQVLLEAGLLPGAILRNRDLRFICRQVYLRCENPDTPFTGTISSGDVLKIPIAHTDGNYYNYDGDIEELEANRQVVFRYCSASGELDDAANPNGARNSIAGICNKKRNVLGLMPHPERAMEKLLGSADGLRVFESIVAHCQVGVKV
jgi:phosphoribosylformylglycinamidine synthase